MKKKLTAVIPIAVMFIILMVLFVFMCLPLGQKTILAANGTLDLRGENMKNAIYQLNGEWQFVYGELLTPEGFRAANTGTAILPTTLDSGNYWLNGCATYRLVINISDMRAPMLYLPEICSSYALYINGRLVRTAGVVSANADKARPLIETALIPVNAENGTIELVIQASNYDYFESSMSIPLLFGESDGIHAYFYRTRALYCMSMGCVLIAASYHLGLYFFRRHEKIYFIFSVLCVLCFARFLVETSGINQFLGWIPINAFGIRLYLMLYFLQYFSIIYFTMYVFNRDFLAKYKCATTAYAVVGFFLFLLMPANQSYSMYVYVMVIFPFLLFADVMAARSPVLRENTWSWLYFAAFLMYTVMDFAGKVFWENVLFMVTLLTNMFMVMAESLVLSKNYARAFELVEETNENLEHIVDERTEDLRNANSAIKELITSISHDLKTPITVMSVNLEELSGMVQAKGAEEYRQHVNIAYQTSLDLQRLLQNLFEVSRIETGWKYALEPVSLPKFLVSVQNKYGDFLNGRGLFFDIDYDEDVRIVADPQKIWSVFDNIIYNAARYTEHGGITVAAEAVENTVTVTVTDTGCGIAQEHLPRIFERFHKASPDRGGNSGDSGLGLYIVKSVIEGIGGSVSAKSEPGKGTSIILAFRRCG